MNIYYEQWKRAELRIPQWTKVNNVRENTLARQNELWQKLPWLEKGKKVETETGKCPCCL